MLKECEPDMSFFGKKVGEYLAFSRTGMILIVLMGLIRFFVGISAVPYERATHLVSMTVLTLLLFVIYGTDTVWPRKASARIGIYFQQRRRCP